MKEGRRTLHRSMHYSGVANDALDGVPSQCTQSRSIERRRLSRDAAPPRPVAGRPWRSRFARTAGATATAPAAVRGGDSVRRGRRRRGDGGNGGDGGSGDSGGTRSAAADRVACGG